jgi:hypothetical protein
MQSELVAKALAETNGGGKAPRSAAADPARLKGLPMIARGTLGGDPRH